MGDATQAFTDTVRLLRGLGASVGLLKVRARVNGAPSLWSRLCIGATKTNRLERIEAAKT